MIGQLAQIWRHPIKGVGAEALAHVGLHVDRPLPLDRAWAVLEEGGEAAHGSINGHLLAFWRVRTSPGFLCL